MITYADAERLLGIRADGRSVLSLYLRVPADPAELRELPARAHDLVELAATDLGAGADASAVDGDERVTHEMLEVHGREWLGHTAALFVHGAPGEPAAGGAVAGGAAAGGAVEAFALPCELPDRAVLASRPHIRPLLVALQRCPAHYVVVVNQRRAWLFRVTGDQIETTGIAQETEQVRSRGFSGWYGLEAHRINDKVIELAHEHLHATVLLLERAMRPGWPEPLVVGGHEQTIPQFVAMLPMGLRDRLAGTFVVDPHTMTPARVRDLARPVIDEWAREREDRLVGELRSGEAPGARAPLTVSGLPGCLAAVNARAVQLLVVPVGGVVGGYACQRCGTLSATGADCECGDGRSESRWVPDLIEEMVTRTIDAGGRVEAVADPPGDVAARLRFPVEVPGAAVHGR